MKKEYSRRRFLETTACGLCAAALTAPGSKQSAIAQDASEGPGLAETEFGDEAEYVREAMHYEPKDEKRIECVLCPRKCRVADRERGYCGVRENRSGTYYTLVFGRVVSAHVDPIEKKPLFHYHPGKTALSVATAGCNMECAFCQNWNISQFRPEQIRAESVSPDRLVAIARERNIECIAHTYSEPVIFYEYVFETGRQAIKEGVGNIIISNGYIEEKALRELLPNLTGVKIDLKAFRDSFYKEQCGGGDLESVLKTLRVLQETGMWYEIVVLIIPTLNDDEQEIRELARFVMNDLSPDVPVHFSRFHRNYKLQNLPSTPVKTLEMAYRVSREEGLRYVYLGNVPGHKAESTYCHGCDEVLVKRYGYRILENRITEEGKCPDCGESIPGVWG